MRRIPALTVLVAALAAAPATAHEARGRTMGVVRSVSPDQITVRASDGHEVVYAITPRTRFVSGGKVIPGADVRVGQRVVVRGDAAPDGPQAIEVKVGRGPAERR